MATRKFKIIIGLVLVLLLVDLGSLLGQDTKTFTGKIKELSRATELDLAKTGTFYVLRLEEYPNIEFRLSSTEAVRSGVIAAGGLTEILTPKQTKGLGWKVQLTCDINKTGPLKTPVYKVLFVERLGD
jgi:hypothetical protein